MLLATGLHAENSHSSVIQPTVSRNSCAIAKCAYKRNPQALMRRVADAAEWETERVRLWTFARTAADQGATGTILCYTLPDSRLAPDTDRRVFQLGHFRRTQGEPGNLLEVWHRQVARDSTVVAPHFPQRDFRPTSELKLTRCA